MALPRTPPQPAEVGFRPGSQRLLWQLSSWAPIVVLSVSLWWSVVVDQRLVTAAPFLCQLVLLALGISLWRLFSWPPVLRREVRFQQRRWWWLRHGQWLPATAAKPVRLPRALGLPGHGNRRVWVFADECTPAEWRRLNVWAQHTLEHNIAGW